MNHVLKRTCVLATAALFCAAPMLARAAGVEVLGNVKMETNQTNSPTNAVAVGPGSKAEARVNTLNNAKVNGNLTMTVNQKNSPTTAVAVGPGSKATALVSAIGN